MPNLIDIAVIFMIAIVAALAVAWAIGKYEPLANLLGMGA